MTCFTVFCSDFYWNDIVMFEMTLGSFNFSVKIVCQQLSIFLPSFSFDVDFWAQKEVAWPSWK